MRKLNIETKVGIFFAVVFILIAFISTRLGNYGFQSRGTYKLSAVFKTAAGVNDGVSVLLAGIKIGFVEGRELVGSRARVFMYIQPNVRIPKDSNVTVMSHGFLGQKYLEIIPGKSSELLETGGEFTNISDTGDLSVLTGSLEEIAGDVKKITANLKEVLGSEEGQEDLRNIFTSISTITTVLADTMESNQDRMDSIMGSFESFAADMSYLSKRNREDIARTMAAFPAIAENLKVISGNLANVLERNDEDINATVANLAGVTESLSRSLEAMANIAQKIDEGQGTVGKLVNEDKTIESINEAVEGVNDYLSRVRRLQVELGYRGEYHVPQNEVKSYFSVNLKPRFDKMFMISLIDSPSGRTHTKITERKTTTNPGTAEEETTETYTKERVTEDSLLFSVQVAKRWHDVLFRGGLIESHGGAGIEYYLFNDHLNFAFEAFDFSADNNPHLKGWANAYFLDHFFLTAGIDDFINKYDDPRYFFGGGIFFTDQDIAYVSSKIPTSMP